MKTRSTVSHFIKTRYKLFPDDKKDTPKSMNHMEIEKHSKKLILSSTNYNDYLNSYKNNTQLYTFHLPGITQYPIRKNFELIPLSPTRSEYSTSNIMSMNNTFTNFSTPSKKMLGNKPIIINQKKNIIKTIKFDNEKKEVNYLEEICNSDLKQYNLSNIDFCIKPIKNDINQKLLLKNSLQFLKEKIEKITNSQNDTYMKSQNYTIKNEKGTFQFNLTCESMCLVFKKKNNDSFSQKIFLPFDLLPLFYLLEWNQFKLFISEIISFQDKVVSLDYLKMEYIIKKYINYVKDNIKVKLNTKLTSSLMNITFFQNEKLFNLSYNWVVEDDDTYTLSIQLPKVSLHGIDDDITLENLLSKKVFIDILQHNFVLWDKKILVELFLHKRVRHIMKIILNGKGDKYKGNSFNLTFIPPPSKKRKEFEYFITTSIGTEECLTDFNILIPHKITMNFQKSLKVFKLDLLQMKNLLKMKKYWPYQETIKKCLNMDRFNNKVKLDLDILDDLDDNFLSNLEALGSIREAHIFSVDKNKYNITVKEPTIMRQTMDIGGCCDKQYFCIPKTIIGELSKNPIENWLDILNKYREKIAHAEPIKVEDQEEIDGQTIRVNRRGSTRINNSNHQDNKLKKKGLYKQFTKQFTITTQKSFHKNVDKLILIPSLSKEKVFNKW